MSCEKSNQRIQSLTSLDQHHDQTRSTKCETSIPKADSNQLNTISGQNIERPLITETSLQQDVDR